MFREVSEKEALQAYQEGKNVLIMQDERDEFPMVYNMAQLMKGKRFVVDEEATVPTVSEPEPEVEETVPDNKPEFTSTQKKGIDTGKVIALYKAGWSHDKIADEMGISKTTVHYHINKYYKKQEG